ncbi:MAG: penicillin-binding protein, partial [Chloroflexota bacterium]|nr:penicillin-binding protein [Chloroflexota bacterium]
MASRTVRRRASFRAVGRHQKHRSHPLLRVIIVLLVGFIMLTSGASAASIFLYGSNLPSLKDFTKRFDYQNTLIRAANGQVLYNMADLSSASRGRRVVEPLVMPGHTTTWYRRNNENWLVGPEKHGIPTVLQDATIATEDASFYNNPGFDPFSIVRAAYQDVTRGHVISGASTITQQLVRNYILTDAPTLSRKAQEILLATELTQKYPKTKILWYYVNSIPYGNLSIGAQAAAETYFHKHVWELDLAQSAFLAGLPEAPSTYDPVNNLPGALLRMRQVLTLMYDHGYLRDSAGRPDPSLISQAMNETKSWPKFDPPSAGRMVYPQFVQYAVGQLQQIPQLKDKVYNGLDVYTTIEPRIQDVAQQTVRNQISQLGSDNVTDGALVSMSLRPGCYGCILAMVGSPDYNDTQHSGQINMADSPRQPGSSFKPFNYIFAFQHGLSPGTSVVDGPLAIPDQGNPADGGWYEPTDYDHTWHGTVTLRLALDNSLNVPAVKVEQYGASVFPNLGLWSIRNQAIKMGIKSLAADNPHCCGWALTLGGMEHGVRLVEETAAYGVFGTEGKQVPPIAIWKVYDRSTHKLLWDDSQEVKSAENNQVVPAPYAYEMDNVLEDDASRCTPQVCEFGLGSDLYLGRPAGAKTGTTNAFTDNWTVGFTPQLVTGVWVGNADNSPMVGTTGITGAAPIWHDFMLKAVSMLNLPPVDFPQPPGVYYGSECRVAGPYTSFGTMPYDIYVGQIPYCSVGGGDQSTLPVPQSQQQ